MNPNPLPLTIRLIVPVIVAMSSSYKRQDRCPGAPSLCRVCRVRSRPTFHLSPHPSHRQYAEASLAFSLGGAIFPEPQNGHAVGTGGGSVFVIIDGRPLSAR